MTHPINLPNKPLLRIDEVAGYFDVSERTVRRWIEKNRVRSIRVGGTIRVYKDSVVGREEKHAGEDKV